jgi:raffinose/stachyose/melibiose transport system permease protein
MMRTALRMRNKQGSGGPLPVPWSLALPGVLAALLFVLLPIAAGSLYAFTSWNGVSARPHFVGLHNFRLLFQEHSTRVALTHTLMLAGSFLVLVNLLGLALALGLNKAVKSRNTLRALFFLPAVISPLAVAYIWQYLFDFGGPLNRLLGAVGLESWKHAWLGDPNWAIWTVLVVLVWQYSGLTMIIFLAGLQAVPDELLEASAVDGAGAWTRFRLIVLPLLAPAMTVNVTLMLILGLRVFDQVIALTGGGPVDASETLATQMWKQTFVLGRFGFGAALAVVLGLFIAAAAVAQALFLRARETRI